jgi:adenylate cyclase
MEPDPRTQQLEAQLQRKTDEIAILTRVALELSGMLELGALLEKILEAMDGVFGFRHSMVLLRDPIRDVLVVAASRGYAESGVGAEVPIGKGVIGVVGKRKKLMRMGGLSLQRDYVQAAGQRANVDAKAVVLPGLQSPASVVAVPLVKRDELIGVFYVESTSMAVFEDRDQSLIEAIASQAAVAIENARFHESSRQFVPHEFLRILGRERLPEVRRGDHAELEMSTFFSDVRDYTTLVEGQGAEENFAFINEYLTYMEEPIRAHGGFIDSYRGDGIMALFAGPAERAVAAAVGSLEALQRFNAARVARGERAIRIGIGIDTGRLMLGTIGGRERLSAGVIGDSANTASRIESLTKRYGAAVLVSEHTRSGCDADRWRMRRVDRIRPRGKAKPIEIYEVLDGLEASELEGKLASRDAFEEGVRLYQTGAPGDGLVCFATALKTCPGDRAAQLYIGRCWNFIENGVPDGWDGVMAIK